MYKNLSKLLNQLKEHAAESEKEEISAAISINLCVSINGAFSLEELEQMTPTQLGVSLLELIKAHPAFETFEDVATDITLHDVEDT